MKKILSLLLTAVMLCSMLAVFTVPVSAVEGLKHVTGTEVITENEFVELCLFIDSGAKVTVKSGATLTVGKLMNSGTLIIEPGATVVAQSEFSNASNAILEVGGKLTSGSDYWKHFTLIGNITIKSGGIIDAVVDLGIYNRFDGPKVPIALRFPDEYCVYLSDPRLTVYSSHDMIDSVCSQCGKSACDINGESHLFQNGKCSKCGYVCPNDFHRRTSECPECGMKAKFSIGSVFSEGGITIIVAFAGILIGMAVMFLIMKKKKPIAANGAEVEKSDEEDE